MNCSTFLLTVGTGALALRIRFNLVETFSNDLLHITGHNIRAVIERNLDSLYTLIPVFNVNQSFIDSLADNELIDSLGQVHDREITIAAK